MNYYYEIIFIVSIILTSLYLYLWHKHFDINITAIFILIPISNLGFMIFGNAEDVDTLIAGIKIYYIGGCYLIYFITMCIMSLCNIEVKKWIRLTGFLICSFFYSIILTIGNKPYYYQDITLKFLGDGRIIVKTYGPLHSIFYITVGIYFAIGITAIIYSLFKKKQISNRVLYLLFLPEIISVFGFFGTALVRGKYEIMPVTFVFAQIVYIFIVKRMSMYNVSDMVIDSMVQTGETGFVSCDFKYHYLGSNETAKDIIPELRSLTVDESLIGNETLGKTVLHWIKHFAEDEKAGRNLYIRSISDNPDDDRMYLVNVNYLYDDKKKRGYQVFLTDDTKNQKYVRLLDKYNSQLEEEVEKKTKHIVEMHDNLILSMATMVESRDNSTGGHIRRTSIGVRILIDEMKKDSLLGLSEEFCRDIIKAAPMHDLGKIAVDDAILRKPGKFTDEEYEKMKTHAAEGAKIIHEILAETDDDSFKSIAENVAHYHHERWDGSGYPEGLKGEEIPLEARIMAIADVYDALVSKRVYKDKMSFEEADKIIMDGMGRQFDEKLKKYYIAARPMMESYYSAIDC